MALTGNQIERLSRLWHLNAIINGPCPYPENAYDEVKDLHELGLVEWNTTGPTAEVSPGGVTALIAHFAPDEWNAGETRTDWEAAGKLAYERSVAALNAANTDD